VLEDGYVCLMDYRFAKKDDGSCTTLCGSPSYFSPEIVRGEKQSVASDWWAFGVLLFELATGKSPWGVDDDDNDVELLKRIADHTFGALKMPHYVSPRLTTLLQSLLEPDMKARRGDGQVINDPWFEDLNWGRFVDNELPSPLLPLAQQQLEDAEDVDDAELEPPDWDEIEETATWGKRESDTHEDEDDVEAEDEHLKRMARGRRDRSQSVSEQFGSIDGNLADSWLSGYATAIRRRSSTEEFGARAGTATGHLSTLPSLSED
jgi:serine/threonine protein kinase